MKIEGFTIEKSEILSDDQINEKSDEEQQRLEKKLMDQVCHKMPKMHIMD